MKAGLRESWRLGWLDREALEKTIDVKGVKGQRELRGWSVSRAELGQSVRGVCERPQQAAGRPGLRDPRPPLRGKGNKQRIAYIPAGPQAALEAWLSLRGGPVASSAASPRAGS